MSVLSDIENTVVSFLEAHKTSLGLARILRGEPKKVETAPAVFVYLDEADLIRTDEKYGRYIAKVIVHAFTGPLPTEVARDNLLDLGEGLAKAFIKDPTLSASGSAFSLNLRIATVKPNFVSGARSQSVREIIILLEIAVDLIDIEVIYP